MKRIITLNGKPHETPAQNLAELLRELGLAPERIVAEVDGAIVPRESFESAPLTGDATVELLRFVGGG